MHLPAKKPRENRPLLRAEKTKQKQKEEHGAKPPHSS
jgi:hypothetical protein